MRFFCLMDRESSKLHSVFILSRHNIDLKKGLQLLHKKKLISKWQSNNAKRKSCVDLCENYEMIIPHMEILLTRLNLTFRIASQFSPRAQNKI